MSCSKQIASMPIECAQELANCVNLIQIKNNNLYFDRVFIGPIIRFNSNGIDKIIIEYELGPKESAIIEIIKP